MTPSAFNNKACKGFTITELVIVIGVIVILAGVLIPAFSGVIERTNQSADIQIVRSMNVALQMESILNENMDFEQAQAVLAENGFTSFVTNAGAHAFYWLPGENVVVIFSKERQEVIYPEAYAGRHLADTWHPLYAEEEDEPSGTGEEP